MTADAPILLFTAIQLVPAPRIRHYLLTCPEHWATIEVDLERPADGSEDAEVLGVLVERLHRAALVDGIACRHVPKGWRAA